MDNETLGILLRLSLANQAIIMNSLTLICPETQHQALHDATVDTLKALEDIDKKL